MSYQPKPIDAIVHGAAMATFPQRTEVDGDIVSAIVPCLEVEIVTSSHRQGNLTLRFAGGDLQAAKDNFVPGAKITMQLSVDPPVAAIEKKVA